MVPPLAGIERPSLAVHVLQACARARGHEVRIAYANLRFAARIGERQYAAFEHMPMTWLLGERLFARSAWGTPALGHDGAESILDEVVAFLARAGNPSASSRDAVRGVLLGLEAAAAAWVGEAAQAVLALEPWAVGCTSTFEQSGASVALLAEIRRRRPEVVTMIGGANCEGEMAEGLAEVAPHVDHLFSGESEVSFLSALDRMVAGEPVERIVAGRPCEDLENLPRTDFSEYYVELAEVLPGSDLVAKGSVYLPYESSRGCWWGQKRHCTFCGLNGEGMFFREKSPQRVIEDLRALLPIHPSRMVWMTDNIMPNGFFRSLVPRLAEELPGLRIFYEQKSNLTLEKVRLLAEAGITDVQPGIEALSSRLLKLMDKGVSGSQNIATLRYCLAHGITLHWSLLVGFPQDRIDFYAETLDLVPRLVHLSPPSLVPVVVTRFSPYFDHAERHGVTDLEPFASYRHVLPVGAPAAKVAYHFTGRYPSESLELGNRPLMRKLAEAVGRWKELWARPEAERPRLEVRPDGEGGYHLVDTRGLGLGPERRSLAPDEAARLVVRRAVASVERGDYAAALEQGLMVELDGSFVPLATASPELLARFEARTTEA